VGCAAGPGSAGGPGPGGVPAWGPRRSTPELELELELEPVPGTATASVPVPTPGRVTGVTPVPTPGRLRGPAPGPVTGRVTGSRPGPPTERVPGPAPGRARGPVPGPTPRRAPAEPGGVSCPVRSCRCLPLVAHAPDRPPPVLRSCLAGHPRGGADQFGRRLLVAEHGLLRGAQITGRAPQHAARLLVPLDQQRVLREPVPGHLRLVRVQPAAQLGADRQRRGDRRQ